MYEDVSNESQHNLVLDDDEGDEERDDHLQGEHDDLHQDNNIW